MEWWQQMTHDQQLKNAVGLSESDLSLLAKSCQWYRELQEDLPARILRYLLDGVDEETLSELTQQIQLVLDAWSSPTRHQALTGGKNLYEVYDMARIAAADR